MDGVKEISSRVFLSVRGTVVLKEAAVNHVVLSLRWNEDGMEAFQNGDLSLEIC